MTPERWRRVDAVVQAALERAPDRRSAYILEVCAGDETLRAEAEALLATHPDAQSFLEHPGHLDETALQDSADLLSLGQTVGHYRIESPLGKGGMGVVYKAKDVRLGRMVAIKMLPDDLAHDRRALERFRREARTASTLNHPNICTIYEVDEFEGQPFLVMELLEGQTLRDCSGFDDEKLLDLAIEFAEALATAHEAHIIHRDLKPANLFLTKLGHLKILDFGLAKLLADDSSQAVTAEHDITASDTTLGTIAYMSPEQALGLQLDARTDLFSFGTTLYELATGKRAFPGTTTATIFDSILHHDPPLVEGPLAPIISKALQKDREHRYQSAADLRADLRRLKHDSGTVSATHKPKSHVVGIAVTATLAIVIAALTIRHLRPLASVVAQQTTIAVLPFSNVSGDHTRDYLQFALPDELITILSHSRTLAVRPFAMTKRFTGDVDPQQVGITLSVSNVITGDYRNDAGRLGLSVESIDVSNNSVVWHDSIDVPAEDLIAMRSQLSERIRSGLFPRLNVSDARTESRPRNDEAYSLFLRAIAMSNEGQANKDAIQFLERAVQLDPAFASAWASLGNRYHYDAELAYGGIVQIEKAEACEQKALSIDPDLPMARGEDITLRVERGDLPRAYEQARAFVLQRPESGEAHFSMSYVLRYAGLLDEAAAECDTALSYDPRNPRLRSCAWVFANLGRFDRAGQFAELDSNSEWTRMAMGWFLVCQGRLVKAERQTASLKDDHLWRTFALTLQQAPRAAIDSEAMTEKRAVTELPDGESAFGDAAVFARCGRTRDALDLLRTGVAKGFCSYPAMDLNHAFDPIRNNSEFQKIHADAIQCQQRFVQWRAKNAS